MTTATRPYPLTAHIWPYNPDDRELTPEYVGTIGGSDVDQIQNIVNHEMHNDPAHFHHTFPMWADFANDHTNAQTTGEDLTPDHDHMYDTLMADIEAWLTEYEGIEWEGGEPYRYH